MRPFEQPHRTTTLIAAGTVLTLLGVGAWVFDLANELQTRSKLTSAAEAGALAACYNLVPPIDEATVKQTAVNWMARNGYTAAESDVRVWKGPAGRPAVTVKLAEPIAPGLWGLVGVRHRTVSVAASATLGGVTGMPDGALPLAVPGYKQADGYYALGSVASGDFRPLVADPAQGGPTALSLVLSAPGRIAGNCVPLATPSAGFADAVRQGVKLQLGQQVPTLAGDLTLSLADSLRARLAESPDSAQVVLPLFAKSAWEADQNPKSIVITGYMVARINEVTPDGTLNATYVERVLPETGVVGGGNGAGALAPVAIDTPRQ